MARKPIDLSKERYGRLQPLYYTDRRVGGSVVWVCQCECGKRVEVSASNLRSGNTKSCGCVMIKDLTNQRFGLLVAKKHLTDKKDNSHYIWECVCDCGNVCLVNSSSLVRGFTSSCGCLNASKGEMTIAKLLDENNIKYKREYTFKDFKLSSGGTPRFDFAVLDENDVVKYLIEYDGIQHFKPSGGWSPQEAVINTQKRDREKNEYCKKNNIPLIRIRYDEQININKLILKGE